MGGARVHPTAGRHGNQPVSSLGLDPVASGSRPARPQCSPESLTDRGRLGLKRRHENDQSAAKRQVGHTVARCRAAHTARSRVPRRGSADAAVRTGSRTGADAADVAPTAESAGFCSDLARADGAFQGTLVF